MGIVSTKGDQAAMLLMNGATLGISSRGVGSLKKIGEQNEVQDDAGRLRRLWVRGWEGGPGGDQAGREEGPGGDYRRRLGTPRF